MIRQDYDDASNMSQITTYYQYDTSNLEPSVVKTSNSKNEWVISNMSYPGDYAISGSINNARASGIQYLKEINDLGANVEKTVQKSNRDGSNLRSISSLFSTYMPNLPYPDSVYTTESSQLLSGFVPAALTASASVIDSQYAPRIVIDSYDGSGNIVQQHKVSDEPTSYIWDYYKDYPIASVKNAAQADVAFTSFEADGSGNWTIPDTTRNRALALTGNISYRLKGTNSISKSSLNSTTTYIVGFWEDSSANTITVNGASATPKITIGNWTYYEDTVSRVTTITVGGMGLIDELKLFPKGALMTTYTYAPLIGMKSQCDPSGKIIYYTYDGLGRLKLIKDQYGNILKRYDYQYQATNQ
jgi:YD repeat-containing protein